MRIFWHACPRIYKEDGSFMIELKLRKTINYRTTHNSGQMTTRGKFGSFFIYYHFRYDIRFYIRKINKILING